MEVISKLIEVLPAQKYRISELLKQQCKVLNSTTIASGYAGRDPQGGTSDGCFFSKFSFMVQSMVKVLLLVLEKKIKRVIVKLRRKWQIEKVEKIENDIYKEIEKSDKIVERLWCW